MAKKFDESKYEVSEDMPERFAQVIPGLGVQHFSKKSLTDNDVKALLKANSPFVKSKEQAEYKEDAPALRDDFPKKKEETKPEFKDIDAGTFPQ